MVLFHDKIGFPPVVSKTPRYTHNTNKCPCLIINFLKKESMSAILGRGNFLNFQIPLPPLPPDAQSPTFNVYAHTGRSLPFRPCKCN